ncbi:MAG TPA: alpha/beta fold hydrolase [Pinirhizobacter sp.]|jgi:pimeloyl-ACP methyl ester carboxylesterase
MIAALSLGLSPDAVRASGALEWGQCSPDLVDKYPELGDRLQCAALRVPRDHHDPGKGKVALPMLRVLAGKPDQRIGSLFVNPGGPGGSATGFAASMGALFSMADPAHPIARFQRDIVDRYDIMAIEPRGLAGQWLFKCRSNIARKATESFDVDPGEANLANIEFNARLESSACQNQPHAALINTDQALRDMDLARAAVGDARLNYFGVSYGTWLGAWYAATFPEHTGRMLLDSNMNWTGSFDEALLDQPEAFQRAFEETLIPFMASHPERFHLGSDPVKIIQDYRQVRPQLRSKNRFWALSADNKQLEFSARVVAGVLLVERILAAHPDIDLDATLMHVDRYFDELGETDANAGIYAKNAARWHFSDNPPRPEQPFELEEEESVYRAVVCNDTSSQNDPDFWRSQMFAGSAQYSLRGGHGLQQPCHDWALPVVEPRDFGAIAQTEGLLMLQASHDPITSSSGAMKAFDFTQNARMIQVENNLTHGLFPQLTQCVDAKVADFLLEGTFPGRMTHCETPQPGEMSVAERSAQPYADADRADLLRQRMRELSTSKGLL